MSRGSSNLFTYEWVTKSIKSDEMLLTIYIIYNGYKNEELNINVNITGHRTSDILFPTIVLR